MWTHRLRSSLVLQLLLGTCGAALIGSTPACDPCSSDPWSAPEPFRGLPADATIRAAVHGPDDRGYVTHWAVGDHGLVLLLDYTGVTPHPVPGAPDLRGVAVTDAQVVVVGPGGTLLTSPLDGEVWTPTPLGTTADLWHVADLTTDAGEFTIAVGDGVMFIRDALAGGWTAVTPPEGGWGDLRVVGSTASNSLLAAGLAGALWTATTPAGPWTRVDAGTTADLTTMGPPGAVTLIGGSDNTLLVTDRRGGWQPLAHDFIADIIDIGATYLLTSDGALYPHNLGVLESDPIATLGPGLRVILAYDFDDHVSVLGDPGRAVTLQNNCAFAGGPCEGRPFIVDELPRTAPAHARADWCAEPPAPTTRADCCAEPPAPTTAAPALRDALARAWTDAALAEHASIASFARAVLELMSLGAPPELLRATQAALADEVEHAALCFAEARRHAPTALGPGPLAIDRGALDRVGDPVAISLAVFAEGCVGEGVSAAIAGVAAEACSDPATAALLRRIAADETRHAALAWRTLRWLVEQFGELVAAPLRARLVTLTGPPSPRESGPDLAAHGRLSARACAELHRAVLRQVVRPLARQLLTRPALAPTPEVRV